MSHVVIDDAAKAKATALVAYAEANPYRPADPGARVPSEDPGHVAVFDSFRVVFSFTETRGVRLRQVSISLVSRRRGMYPDPIMAFAIADLLGFTGWTENAAGIPPPGWGFWPVPANNCVMIIQPIGSTVPREAMS